MNELEELYDFLSNGYDLAKISIENKGNVACYLAKDILLNKNIKTLDLDIEKTNKQIVWSNMVETNMTEMNGISTSDKQDGVEIIYL